MNWLQREIVSVEVEVKVTRLYNDNERGEVTKGVQYDQMLQACQRSVLQTYWMIEWIAVKLCQQVYHGNNENR
jgi:hypothetical protein